MPSQARKRVQRLKSFFDSSQPFSAIDTDANAATRYRTFFDITERDRAAAGAGAGTEKAGPSPCPLRPALSGRADDRFPRGCNAPISLIYVESQGRRCDAIWTFDAMQVRGYQPV